MSTERKKRTKRAIIIAIALLLLVYLISGTYARYFTTGEATGTVQVAKWAIKMTADDGTELNSTTKPITFKVQNNNNVVPGKIAPAVTAVAEIELDLTGTEVAVDFDAVFSDSAKAEIFGSSANDVTLSVMVDGVAYTSGTSQLIALPTTTGENPVPRAFTADDSKKVVTLTLTWTNNESQNANDTSVGNAAGTLTIPVTLTAKQHIN